ncbi:WD40 repeat [Arabidopsis suecica]|uniref:WD40 repeat n=1 Tax=Arabidopsis suecica TaxID=45249 RepID=A0A8T1ZCV3_ARASU|nr:WD40 repeat [Arabidopsis suecica]
MATTAMNKPKIEQGEEVEAEVRAFSTQIPDDREALLEFMDQRAKSIQRLKDQISSFDRKLAEERKLMADAEAKFLQIDRGENGTFSKSKPKVPGKTGSILGIAEFWTEGNKAKTANENSTPQSRSEMESLKMPSIILPPSFKRRASAPVRAEVNETTQAQPMATRDYNISKEDTSGPEPKRPRSIPDEVVRETQGRDKEAQPMATKPTMDYNVPKEDKSVPEAKSSRSIPNEVVRESQGRDNVAQPMDTRDYNVPKEDKSGLEAKRSHSIPNEVVWETQAQARDNHTNKDFAKPRIRVSSNISQQGQQEKAEFRGHDELIALIGRSSLRPTIEGRTVGMLPSCHTKRMRSLALSPSNRELFATSALDGAVHFWKLQSDRSTATLFKTVNRVAINQKKWAEDIAWHPHKSALFSAYTADEGHPQISAIYLNEAGESCKSQFLEGRPHSKGLINRIMFTPWDDPCFITGGSDHAVVLWRDQCENNAWKPTLLHRDLHSSAVMGVTGMRHKNLVLSCGDDRRFVGFDAREEKVTFKHRLDNRCTNILPNPRDVNLVMVHTRQLDRQLRLYDVRLPQTELFSFGWKQESSESQSALINQSWSPDGLHISSGSADPVIHIFDIRYNAPSPSLSMKAHKKRVFKAEWHSSYPLLVSISSDLAIGIHKLW